MSYCRFSSEDWRCDVYVWAAVHGGYRTEVASTRFVFDGPLPAPVGVQDPGFFERLKVVSAMADRAERVKIDLPHAGEGFHDETPGECADRLIALKALGYCVPQYAIDELRREQAEGSQR